MYTQWILTRFAENLEKNNRADEARDFLSGISNIQFETSGRFYICMWGAVWDALIWTAVEHLAHELAQRVHEFVTEEDEECARGIYELDSLRLD